VVQEPLFYVMSLHPMTSCGPGTAFIPYCVSQYYMVQISGI